LIYEYYGRNTSEDITGSE